MAHRPARALVIGLVTVASLLLGTPAALAACVTQRGDHGQDDGYTAGDAYVTPTGRSGSIVAGARVTINAELTGYSYWDNNPPGSAEICCGVLHTTAGGRGTFADPVTVATPTGETAPGTRLYIPRIKRYAIVEDSGATGMDLHHFDIYVDGAGHPEGASERCMDEITGQASVMLNPPPGYPVTAGPLTGSSGCVI